MKVNVMDPRTQVALVLGISIPLLVFLVACFCLLLCRRWGGQQHGSRGYSIVEDDLDEEEIEFKRMIEKKADEAVHEEEEEDLENLFGGGGNSFSERDKDRLSMLENMRSNLVKGAASLNNREHESDSETDKMRL